MLGDKGGGGGFIVREVRLRMNLLAELFEWVEVGEAVGRSA